MLEKTKTYRTGLGEPTKTVLDSRAVVKLSYSFPFPTRFRDFFTLFLFKTLFSSQLSICATLLFFAGDGRERCANLHTRGYCFFAGVRKSEMRESILTTEASNVLLFSNQLLYIYPTVLHTRFLLLFNAAQIFLLEN